MSPSCGVINHCGVEKLHPYLLCLLPPLVSSNLRFPQASLHAHTGRQLLMQIPGVTGPMVPQAVMRNGEGGLWPWWDTVCRILGHAVSQCMSHSMSYKARHALYLLFGGTLRLGAVQHAWEVKGQRCIQGVPSIHWHLHPLVGWIAHYQ
jgi:hypothetical protein